MAAASSIKPTTDRSPMQPVRVMIVDDSLTTRTVLRRVVEQDHRLCHAASANSAEQAIGLLDDTPVDVILLDLEMPGMGGLDALPEILRRSGDARVLVVSSLTTEGAEATLAALSMGATDTIPKPSSGSFDSDYREALLHRILQLGQSERTETTDADPAFRPPRLSSATCIAPKIVAIGASTGGIHALCRFLGQLTPEFRCPILVTQHLPLSFMGVFARQLELASSRKAVIASDGAIPHPGTILVAPGDGHLRLENHAGQLRARIDYAPAPSGCMPSVDPMLASLAESCGPGAVGVILSGMGRDGAEGAAGLVAAGGRIMAQDAQSSAVWGMPGAVARAGLASVILPPDQLARQLLTSGCVTAG